MPAVQQKNRVETKTDIHGDFAELCVQDVGRSQGGVRALRAIAREFMPARFLSQAFEDLREVCDQLARQRNQDFSEPLAQIEETLNKWSKAPKIIESAEIKQAHPGMDLASVDLHLFLIQSSLFHSRWLLSRYQDASWVADKLNTVAEYALETHRQFEQKSNSLAVKVPSGSLLGKLFGMGNS